MSRIRSALFGLQSSPMVVRVSGPGTWPFGLPSGLGRNFNPARLASLLGRAFRDIPVAQFRCSVGPRLRPIGPETLTTIGLDALKLPQAIGWMRLNYQ